ncbi:hypothetical protein [Thermococcus sp.]
MEKVIYVVGNVSYKKGFMKESHANLVITGKRLIVAFVTAEMAKQAKEEAGGGIKGFLKGMIAPYGMWKKYYDMNPSDILNETPENFEIPLQEIKEVKLKKGDPESGKRDELEIKAEKKLKFSATSGNLNMKEIKNVFKEAGIKVKGGGLFR